MKFYDAAPLELLAVIYDYKSQLENALAIDLAVDHTVRTALESDDASEACSVNHLHNWLFDVVLGIVDDLIKEWDASPLASFLWDAHANIDSRISQFIDDALQRQRRFISPECLADNLLERVEHKQSFKHACGKSKNQKVLLNRALLIAWNEEAFYNYCISLPTVARVIYARQCTDALRYAIRAKTDRKWWFEGWCTDDHSYILEPCTPVSSEED